jgi:hypothetical protein
MKKILLMLLLLATVVIAFSGSASAAWNVGSTSQVNSAGTVKTLNEWQSTLVNENDSTFTAHQHKQKLVNGVWTTVAANDVIETMRYYRPTGMGAIREIHTLTKSGVKLVGTTTVKTDSVSYSSGNYQNKMLLNDDQLYKQANRYTAPYNKALSTSGIIYNHDDTILAKASGINAFDIPPIDYVHSGTSEVGQLNVDSFNYNVIAKYNGKTAKTTISYTLTNILLEDNFLTQNHDISAIPSILSGNITKDGRVLPFNLTEIFDAAKSTVEPLTLTDYPPEVVSQGTVTIPENTGLRVTVPIFENGEWMNYYTTITGYTFDYIVYAGHQIDGFLVEYTISNVIYQNPLQPTVPRYDTPVTGTFLYSPTDLEGTFYGVWTGPKDAEHAVFQYAMRISTPQGNLFDIENQAGNTMVFMDYARNFKNISIDNGPENPNWLPEIQLES